MSNVLDVEVAASKFEEVKNLRGGPVTHEIIFDNIKASVGINAPVFHKQKHRDGAFIFVAGGPTLIAHLNEIRARSERGEFICTSNNTYDFLIENGIVPNACCVIDPKEIVKTYIKKPNKRTTFYIGIVCNPAVGTQLVDAGMDVMKVCTAYGMDDEADVKMQMQAYPDVKGLSYLVGGTMMGLRAMPMALLLGFKKIEYYGFDSCFADGPKIVMEDEPGYTALVEACDGRHYEDPDTKKKYAMDESGGTFYAYAKKRGENIQVAETTDGKRFLTSPCFAHQAKQFIKWADRYDGKLDIIVHGHSLSSHWLELHRKNMASAFAEVGDKRWTGGYAKLQGDLHTGGQYGTDHGIVDIELFGRPVLAIFHAVKRAVRILDYGCGHAQLENAVKRYFTPELATVTGYDPFVERYSAQIDGKYDVVTCFDVMEHIEYQCVDNVLRHIAERTGYVAVFAIATSDAVKNLADGRNAHITQRSPEWWVNKLSKYFQVAEATYTANGCHVTCQALEAKENVENEPNRNQNGHQEA